MALQTSIKTVPHQRTVRIHREKVETNFLGIKNENWMEASRNLRPHALLLYLYLAANKDNYKLALSPEAIRQEIGMARSTYHDQFKILVDKGYLVLAHGNTYDFYEVARPVAEKNDEDILSPFGEGNENSTNDDKRVSFESKNYPEENIEINNNPTNCGIDREKTLPKVEEKPVKEWLFNF